MSRARVSVPGQAVCLASSLAFCLGVSVQASAQSTGTPWLPDRQYKEGPGIKAGELELHPGVAIRGGYDSNVFRADGKNGSLTGPDARFLKIQDAGILAISPHLYLSTQTAQRAQGGEDRPGVSGAPFLAFRTGLAAHYFHYFLDDAPHAVGAEAEVFLGVAQNRPVGADVSFEYVRSVSPFTQDAGNRNAYIFDTILPRLRLNFRSRSNVLSAYVGYVPKYTHYESGTFNYLNNVQHGAEVGSAWRFLPNTAMVYDANFTYQDYTNPARPDLILTTNSKSFRTRLGINGALTNKIALRVLAGYAVGFLNQDELDDFEDGIGEVVLTYRFNPHYFELGYQRDVQISPLGGWSQTDRGFGRLGFLFARRFSLGFEAGVAHANYGRLVRLEPNGDPVGLGLNGDSSRDDIRIDGAIRTEYRATNWLAFMADFVAQSVITDFDFAQPPRGTGTALIPDPAGFTYYQIFGGVRAHY